VDGNFEAGVAFPSGDVGPMMDPWKNSSASQRVEQRIGVPSKYENAGTRLTLVVPLNGNAMSGVLRGQTRPSRQTSGANLGQSNQANSDHGPTVDQLGSQWSRQQSSCDVGIAAIVHENPAIDFTVENRQQAIGEAEALG